MLKFILRTTKKGDIMKEKVCTGCGRKTTNYVTFPCVKCGHEIIRCANCRARALDYTCPNCGTSGP